MLLFGLFDAAGTERFGYDFRAVYYPAAESVRAGESPYDFPEGSLPYVYPPQVAIAVVPLTTLGEDLAALVAVLVSLGALIGALAVVGVRDIRCYAAVLLWAPGWNALEMANVTALLVLALALAWRFRATVWPLGAVLGVAVSAKIFLWPLLVWAAAGRRLLATAVAVGVASAVTLGAWAVIGFDGLSTYREQLAEIDFANSYSLRAMAEELGLDPLVGTLASVLVGGALLGATMRLSRRGDEVRSFTCAVGAALVLTPVVWQHYLALLAVPLALARPRFGVVWVLPVLLWLSPRAGNGDGIEPFLPAIVAALVLGVILSHPRSHAAVPAGSHA
jgi:hypothetical protein